MSGALFALLLDFTMNRKPASAATAPSNPMHMEVARRTMDQAANSVVKYHGGWCIVAVRRKLVRSNEPEDLLRIIPKFGTDLMVTGNVKHGDEHAAADSSNSDDDDCIAELYPSHDCYCSTR